MPHMSDFSWLLFLSFNIILLLSVMLNMTLSSKMMLKLKKSNQESASTLFSKW